MSVWGHLSRRYEGTSRRRRLLALDGGGVRGLVTLEILGALEETLGGALPDGDARRAFRLCDYFDYIAGTSTGAIIAAGLARGMRVADLRRLYRDFGEEIFTKRSLTSRLKSLYGSTSLESKLKEVFEGATLEPRDLKCLLLVVMRNATTDSPWPISSNPLARYNATTRPDCNLKIPLWKLVRASAAAPIFFPPEVIQWDPDNPKKRFVFVDGGVTPYNNPAFLLYRMATSKPFRLEWPQGERNLLLVSIGTGAGPQIDDYPPVPGADAGATVIEKLWAWQQRRSGGPVAEKNIVKNLMGLPSALIYGSTVDQDTNCRTIGRCVEGASIDSELGDLISRGDDALPHPLRTDLDRKFLYARYDARIDDATLAAAGYPHLKPQDVGRLDSVAHMEPLTRLGRGVADRLRDSPFWAFMQGDLAEERTHA